MDAGLILIYSGTKPVNANTAIGVQTLLVTLTFNATAFGAAASGVITANAITGGTAVANGTATFARIFETDTTTVVADVDVGTSGAGINLTTTTISIGDAVTISAWTHTVTE